MAKPRKIPITPSVLTWAIQEAGYTTETLAQKLKVPVETVHRWQESTEQPTLTHFRNLAKHLKRIPAVFLLPAPPVTPSLQVQFRHPPGARTDLNPVERHYIREARRLQEACAWLTSELGEPTPTLPQMSLSADPDRMGAEMRRRLTGTEGEAFGADWRTASQAFEAWRELLERSGVLVFLFPLGKDSCQGFSLWHEDAPLIAVNTAWNHQARIFTVFHEYGHLLTRTSSACLERSGQRTSQEEDEWERSCERFAASLLISSVALEKFLRERFGWRPNEQIADLNKVRELASRFKVSLRAATIRLIELGTADWSLYREISAISDAKPKGAGGGGRDRGEIREDQYGPRTVSVFVRALDRNILSRADVLEYLDVSDSHLERLHPGPAG